MSNFLRSIRQTLTVARRDFTATVFTPTFLLFLLTPVIMIGFGVISSLAGRSVAGNGEARQRIVAIATPEQAHGLTASDAQFRPTIGGGRPSLRIDAPTRNPAAQARALFDHDPDEVTAVLYGPLATPTILHTGGPRDASYLALLADQTLRAARAGGTTPLSVPHTEVIDRRQASTSGKNAVAYFAVVGIFFLTLFLSGQAVGSMAEERSNKVIEVLAAAVSLESVFLGKLLGMFGSAVLFVCFWAAMIAGLPKLLPPNFASVLSDLGPAVGYPAFPLLFVAYFTMSYLLMGSVFLSVGALTSTQRELQMLSLPITVIQFAMFGWASYAVSHPGDWATLAAEVFPLSSPMAMIGRSANSPEIWPHLLAIGWQVLWVAIVVTIAARLFRRGVLKSGPPKARLRKARA